jgi:hypothetical protein
VIDSISASFNWHCAEVGKDSPFLNKRFVLILKGMKRALRKPTVPQLPFLRLHVRRFMRFSRGSFGTGELLWSWQLVLLTFYASARC